MRPFASAAVRVQDSATAHDVVDPGAIAVRVDRAETVQKDDDRQHFRGLIANRGEEPVSRGLRAEVTRLNCLELVFASARPGYRLWGWRRLLCHSGSREHGPEYGQGQESAGHCGVLSLAGRIDPIGQFVVTVRSRMSPSRR